jgi:hypothetical protein
MESWSCAFSIATNLDAFSWPRIHSMCLMPECKYTKSISSSAQYVSLQKYFSHPSLVFFIFPTSPLKFKLGLQIGGRQLIANRIDQSQSLWLVNQIQGPVVRSYLLHSSLAGVRLCCDLYRP